MINYISNDDIEEARKTSPVVFGPIGEDIYKRTYSRNKQDGTQEDWYETIARVVNGNLNYVPSHFIEKSEASKLFKLLIDMEVLPAGRHLWATGIGKDFLNNCFSAAFTEEFTEHFTFTFRRLMEGGGVGANYSNLFINSSANKKPWVVKSKINLHIVCHPNHLDYNTKVPLEQSEELYGCTDNIEFTKLLSSKYSHDWDPGYSNGEGALYLRVTDSREGWSDALFLLLCAHMDKEQDRDLVIDVSNIRPHGAILKGFGGKASGPFALMLLLIRTNLLLNNRTSLSSLDYMLIDHYIAQAVVAGGSRRSARMAMKYWKDPDIFEFINCKKVLPGQIPAHWTTNISVVIDKKFFSALKREDEHACKVYDTVIENMLANGEPGFVNASKCLEGEPPGTEFFTTNPCGEVTMIEYLDMPCFDVCCLGHVNLDRVKNPEEAFRLITRFLIRATFAKISDDRQRQNVERNRRIGVGILGYHSWLVKNKIKYSEAPNNEKIRDFFKRMKRIIDEEARNYCSQLRIPECVKKTVIAPTGTIGNLAGSTTGCQPLFSKFYIRRVRFSNTDEILQNLKEKYTIESDLYAANTSVVNYLCVDPLYDQVVDLLKKENMLDGHSNAKAQGLAENEATELIEDQYELSLTDFLATQRMLQKEFVDNAISITINVDPSKVTKEDIKSTLKHYLPDLKGITLFPELTMPQTPFERITYDELLQAIIEGREIERAQPEMICVGGCPVK